MLAKRNTIGAVFNEFTEVGLSNLGWMDMIGP
jgi:hypothetical protein